MRTDSRLRYFEYVSSVYSEFQREQNLVAYAENDSRYRDDRRAFANALLPHFMRLIPSGESNHLRRPEFFVKLFTTALNGASLSRTFFLLEKGRDGTEAMTRCAQAGFLFTVSFNLIDYMVDDLKDGEVTSKVREILFSDHDLFGQTFHDRFLRALLNDLLARVRDRSFFVAFQDAFVELIEYLESSQKMNISQALTLRPDPKSMVRNSTKYVSVLYVISRQFAEGTGDLIPKRKTFEDMWRIYSLFDDILDVVEDVEGGRVNYLDSLLLAMASQSTGNRPVHRYVRALQEGDSSSMLDAIVEMRPYLSMLNEHMSWYRKGMSRCWGPRPDTDPQYRWLLRGILLETQRLKSTPTPPHNPLRPPRVVPDVITPRAP